MPVTSTQPTLQLNVSPQSVAVNLQGGVVSTTVGTSGVQYNKIIADVTATSNNGYITGGTAIRTVTLPPTSTIGDILEVIGETGQGWKIAQGVNQQIILGMKSTTIGVGGYIQSVDVSDSIRLVCTTANLIWRVVNLVGNLTFV